MTIRRTRFEKGIENTPTNIEGIGGTDLTRDGEIATDSSDNELKVRLNGDTKTVVTEDQTQVLTNKTIDADLNTIVDLEVDNLKSGVLNVSTSLSGASDTQIPSALAVKTYIIDSIATKDQAIEISYDPTTSGLAATNVQAAIDEVDFDLDAVQTILGDHIADTSDAHDASAISSIPSGNLVATEVQAALNELQGDIDTANTNIGIANTNLNNHLNDTSDAHDASAISNIPSGNLAATDVQTALNELQSDIDLRALTTNGSIITPTRLDVKQGTKANLITYAATASNGQVVFATDTKEYFAVTDNALVSLGGGGISLWVTAKDYVVNNVIIESNKIYRCLIAHTSGTFATDLAASKWVEVSAYANLTGAVTSVGAATSLGSFSSSNLSTALSDKTGTGVNVFDTSPTLVTPNIGVANGTSLVLGGTINANAVADFQSTTKAFMPPRMTTTQKNAITPVAGMELYDSDLNIKQYYNGSQWIANTRIQLDNEFSATISSGTTVSTSRSGWVSCTNSSTAVCTFQSGLFTVAPSCRVTTDNSLSTVQGANFTGSITTSSVSVFQSAMASGTPVNGRFYLSCTKQGADYQSTDAYIASNGNYDWTSYTPTTPNSSFAATPTGITVGTNECQHSRVGSELLVRCKFTTGVAQAVEGRISLPIVNGSQLISAGTSVIPTIQQAGWFYRNSASVNSTMAVLIEPSVSYFTFTNIMISASTNPFTKGNPSSSVANSELEFFTARIPIAGWTNSNLIVASLAGTPNIPGLTTAVDAFSVNYGTTNAITSCTASPCSYLDQIGTAVTSMTRTGIGLYTLNVGKSYAKLKCVNAFSHQTQGGFTPFQSSMSCANCSTLSFQTGNTVGFFDTFGVVMCQGSY